MSKYEVEVITIHPENPYIKVYLSVDNNIEHVHSYLEKQFSVDHVNVVENQAGTRRSLIVYPMKIYNIDEVRQKIESSLTEYFGRDAYKKYP